MYLKSLEVHGFKSFANKIVFDFHNGITGIVGPNGSGKSNVADAVRWVLGEQSVKQLRGASMQDVIFSGTENRKPLGYAYVAMTLDNSDGKLPVDFQEVTVIRRVYRSGESEYLLNGTKCRLKDIHELFYDTGIGKEGYSIIGQGQIDKILNGKPEERRELFDEAAGIVKFKRRKELTQKKLESEKQNLIRINDILSELEKQVGPLETQAEKAKIYLKEKESLKKFDILLFLEEVNRVEEETKVLDEKLDIAKSQLEGFSKQYESTKEEYETLEHNMAQAEEEIRTISENLQESKLLKEKQEGTINLFQEQINYALKNIEQFQERIQSMEEEISNKEEVAKEYLLQMKEQESTSFEKKELRKNIIEQLDQLQKEIVQNNTLIDEEKGKLIDLLNDKSETQGKAQRYEALNEQVLIRKSQLTQRILKYKSEVSILEEKIKEQEVELVASQERKNGIVQLKNEILIENKDLEERTINVQREYEETQKNMHQVQTKLDSLKNMAERYDGYGNSIKKVMEKKSEVPGVIGVVADLIQVEKKFELAIETALGGSIQNIVTDTQETGKKMISYLKANKLGRATFLPISSVTFKKSNTSAEYLSEKGVIGLADTLVNTKEEYSGVFGNLLGRTFVVDHIDNGIALSRKSNNSLRIVTLEGDLLSPGGSMTGGAFRNSSNLLGRKRELDELELELGKLVKERDNLRFQLKENKDAQRSNSEKLEELNSQIQTETIAENTLLHNKKQSEESIVAMQNSNASLMEENNEIEQQLNSIRAGKGEISDVVKEYAMQEEQLHEAVTKLQSLVGKLTQEENQIRIQLSEIDLEIANKNQKTSFIKENRERVLVEIATKSSEVARLKEELGKISKEKEDKVLDIDKIYVMIKELDTKIEELQNSLEDNTKRNKELSISYKMVFEKREEITKQISLLDKEVYRLTSQEEKSKESLENSMNYMWNEYELTKSACKEEPLEELEIAFVKKEIVLVKERIKKLGDVNVNAIEDFKSVSERYEFLKVQRDDLVTAEATLLEIIKELDIGMRNQFREKFEAIRIEFDKAFKELFGGGKGTLELVEGEDILETGIRIIAQPPGKKLQNMMQLSGGEKALTAIALLFAIQNLKPSPFCLLDEIEAALDDSNVTRFAKYLSKLTKNTQFIIITHRRGTMAASDRLYGITMQEKGISTLVSVNLIEDELDK